jgi:hypothetical protein
MFYAITNIVESGVKHQLNWSPCSTLMAFEFSELREYFFLNVVLELKTLT